MDASGPGVETPESPVEAKNHVFDPFRAVFGLPASVPGGQRIIRRWQWIVPRWRAIIRCWRGPAYRWQGMGH